MIDIYSQPEDFRPTASLETLGRRAALLADMRNWFTTAGYLEVETPLLSRDTVVDAWLEPFVTRDMAAAGEWFLQTSPEFHMKRLLAAGATAIFQITRAFRQGERGRLHNPEFTMVEWYRTGDTYRDQMDFVEQLVTQAARCGERLASPSILRGDQRPFERIAYDEAFRRHAGTPVLRLTAGELAELAARRGISGPQSLRRDDRDGWLNLLLAELVEPHLGRERGTFLYDYPASQAALATIRPGEPPVAERFELYVGGIELCNGYQELTDADELRRRIERQSEIRRLEGLRPLPASNRLLDAMTAGPLPACAGVALGFDRLAMPRAGEAVD